MFESVISTYVVRFGSR